MFSAGFYFLPDASLIEMRTAKSNWQKLSINRFSNNS